jgi:Kef-type K+ transport system membrane component KefB
MSLAHHPVFVVLLAAVLAPLLTELPVGRRVPVIVLEVVLGIVVGPHVLDLIRFDAFLSTMLTIGMAAVLFMAGRGSSALSPPA